MFRVVWMQTAVDDLTTLWLQADVALRKAITKASHQIDQALKSDPFQCGESRGDGDRVVFARPLGVLFEVLSESSTVRVIHVWDIRAQK
jgi:hypothetical protein